jgi:hypothetical protein
MGIEIVENIEKKRIKKCFQGAVYIRTVRFQIKPQ